MFNTPKEYNPVLHQLTMASLVMTEPAPSVLRLHNDAASASEAPLLSNSSRPPLLIPFKSNNAEAEPTTSLTARLSSLLASFGNEGKPGVPEIDSEIVSPRKHQTLAAPPVSACNVRTPNRLCEMSTEVTILNTDRSVKSTEPLLHQLQIMKNGLDSLRSDVSTLTSNIIVSMKFELATVIQFQSDLAVRAMSTLQEKLRRETDLRRKLHNLVQELKGNIRVYVRIRPLLLPEIDSGKIEVVHASTDTELSVIRSEQKREFAFDRVFGQKTDNSQLFNDLQQLIVSSLDGFNVAILAYGITGSGKTYTMQGIYERLGIDLFEGKTTRETDGGWKYTFEISVFEVYNETIIDLLNPKNLDINLKINASTGFFHIPGITKLGVTAPSDIHKVMAQASRCRSVSSTNSNEQSSRSHLITWIQMKITTPSNKQIESKLSLVDLAGSERLNKSGAVGVVAKEGMHINKSLSALGDVINARVSRSSHVPYRNSVLTSALQDCIAGESKTLVILQVNPSHDSVEETYTSLVFASRVREVEVCRPQLSPRRK